MKEMINGIDIVLRKLAGKIDDFSLGGGTALSRFYFKHRESYDLDFFTKSFSTKRIKEVVGELSEVTGYRIDLKAQQLSDDMAKILIYEIEIADQIFLKIDFIEDLYKVVGKTNVVNGIPLFSKEDIYFRKIYAACGSFAIINDIRKKQFKGGRQDAKDYFDIYYLSSTFKPLSDFVEEYCDNSQIESVIIWYRSFNRMEMTTGLLEIKTDKNIGLRQIDQHIGKQIEKIVSQRI